MEKASGFPKFECVISNTNEEYDSEFLKSLLVAENPEDEVLDVLLRAKDDIPAILTRAQTKA